MNEHSNFLNIKCKYVIEEVLKFLDEKRKLQIINYNNSLQKLMGININNYKNNYKDLSSIEIEITPSENYGNFINLYGKNKKEKNNYHIYIDGSKIETKNKYYLNESDNVTKIKILIAYNVKSLAKLFWKCEWRMYRKHNF